MRKILLDTGPLVAFLNRRDQHHQWGAMAQWEQLIPPLLTCEAVLAETCFIVRNLHGGSQAVIELVRRGVLAVPFRITEEIEVIGKLLARYTNVPMSLADAFLVRMAEQYPQSAILTIDSDFRLYRRHGRQIIPVIMPETLT